MHGSEMFLTHNISTHIDRPAHMKYSLLPAIIFLLSGMVSLESQASPSLPQHYIQLAQANNQSLNSAAQAIKQKTGGRILSAKTVGPKGHRVYKIKVLLPSGKVQVFKINAN